MYQHQYWPPTIPSYGGNFAPPNGTGAGSSGPALGYSATYPSQQPNSPPQSGSFPSGPFPLQASTSKPGIHLLSPNSQLPPPPGYTPVAQMNSSPSQQPTPTPSSPASSLSASSVMNPSFDSQTGRRLTSTSSMPSISGAGSKSRSLRINSSSATATPSSSVGGSSLSPPRNRHSKIPPPSAQLGHSHSFSHSNPRQLHPSLVAEQQWHSHPSTPTRNGTINFNNPSMVPHQPIDSDGDTASVYTVASTSSASSNGSFYPYPHYPPPSHYPPPPAVVMAPFRQYQPQQHPGEYQPPSSLLSRSSSFTQLHHPSSSRPSFFPCEPKPRRPASKVSLQKMLETENWLDELKLNGGRGGGVDKKTSSSKLDGNEGIRETDREKEKRKSKKDRDGASVLNGISWVVGGEKRKKEKKKHRTNKEDQDRHQISEKTKCRSSIVRTPTPRNAQLTTSPKSSPTTMVSPTTATATRTASSEKHPILTEGQGVGNGHRPYIRGRPDTSSSNSSSCSHGTEASSSSTSTTTSVSTATTSTASASISSAGSSTASSSSNLHEPPPTVPESSRPGNNVLRLPHHPPNHPPPPLPPTNSRPSAFHSAKFISPSSFLSFGKRPIIPSSSTRPPVSKAAPPQLDPSGGPPPSVAPPPPPPAGNRIPCTSTNHTPATTSGTKGRLTMAMGSKGMMLIGGGSSNSRPGGNIFPPESDIGPPAMRDLGGQGVWLCSAILADSVHPCKAAPHLSPPVRMPFGGTEVSHIGRYDILPFDETFMIWRRTEHGKVPLDENKQPYRPVEGGYEKNGQHLWHARAEIQGIKVPGKTGTHLNGANFAFGGTEIVCQSGYDILCWRS